MQIDRMARKLSTMYVLLSTVLVTGISFVQCSSQDAKFQQYYVKGEQLYKKNCSNCHQKSGKGLGRLYPPLAESDFMAKNFDETLCLMRYGRDGEMEVNGRRFNKSMPAIPSLTDLEIAEIATYIYNSWGSERGIIEVKDAAAMLASCTNKP